MTLKLGLLSTPRLASHGRRLGSLLSQLFQRWSQVPAVSLVKTWLILALGKALFAEQTTETGLDFLNDLLNMCGMCWSREVGPDLRKVDVHGEKTLTRDANTQLQTRLLIQTQDQPPRPFMISQTATHSLHTLDSCQPQ